MDSDDRLLWMSSGRDGFRSSWLSFLAEENEFVSTYDSLGAPVVSASCELFVAWRVQWVCCSLKLLAQFLVHFVGRYQPG